MPGFVDVTGWTSEEVRRMGHADDYDDIDHRPRRSFNRNPYGYNDSNRPARAASAKYTISDTWAAACAANRINGGYHKDAVYEWNETERRNVLVLRKNRDVMMEFLADPTHLTVDDIERGEHCRQFLENDLTFRTLKGKTGEFDNAIRKVLAVKDHFDNHFHKYELAIVACLPQSVERTEIRQNSNNRVQFATGGFVGEIDSKVECQIEVLNSQFSKQYNVYWVRGITDADQAVYFSSKESYDPGTHLSIKGTVKAHKENLTQLNRVKVL